MSGAVDLFLVYQFIRRLATPFTEWEAHKLGIIDHQGNILKKKRELRTVAERRAFGVYDRMILNIKKILEKVPGGQSRLASYTAALYLIKEWNHFSSDTMLHEGIADEELRDSLNHFIDGTSNYPQLSESVNRENAHSDDFFAQFYAENAPTVNAGSGNVAGIGVGPDGEPGFSKVAVRRHKNNTKRKTLRDIIGQVPQTDK